MATPAAPRRRPVLAGVLTLLAAAALAAPTAAYQAIDVQGGATLRGRIRYEGVPPTPTRIRVTTDRGYCGDSVTDLSLRVDADGGVADAVVYLADIDRGKAPDRRLRKEVAIEGCLLRPRVLAMTAGQTLVVRNADPLRAEVDATLNGELTIFHEVLPLRNQEVLARMKRPGAVRLHRTGHDWAVAHVIVRENPYLTVSATDGRFELRDIPPGTYTVVAWHERLGKRRLEVAVPAAGGETETEIVFVAP